MQPVSMLIADRSAMFTSTVVIAGISIVIGVLLFLIFIFYLFGTVVSKTEARVKKKEKGKEAVSTAVIGGAKGQTAVSKTQAKAKKTEKEKEEDMKNIFHSHKKENKPAPAVSGGSPAMAVQPGISGEVVAAIAAAVAMYEGPQAVVRSIRKVNVVNVGSRNPWAAAALAENTRPF